MDMRATFAIGCILFVGSAIAAPRGQAANVDGNWQINIGCALFATATSFVDLIDDDSGTIIATTPECGTLEVPGAIHEITSCTFTPDPRVGTTSGVTLSFPATPSLGRSDSMTDTPFDFVGFCQAARVVNDSRFQGSVVEESLGVATRISGTVVNGLLEVYLANGSLCFTLPDAPDCTFEMLRNAVPAGSDVTVAPRSGSSVTFASILAPGTAAVVPVTTPSASVPANFSVLGAGGIPLYYDVRTTAVHAGSITTCFAYPDADNDGLVDGSGVAEVDLRVLHEEGATFVDRTSSLDPDANVICAQTSSLSQLTVAQGPAGGPPAVCSSQPRSGCKRSLKPAAVTLRIRDRAGDTTDRVQWTWRRGAAVEPNDFGDPFSLAGNDYALCLYDLAGAPAAPMFEALMPRNGLCGEPDCWQGSPKRLRYRLKGGAPHGVLKASVHSGTAGKGKLKVLGLGALLAAGPQGSPPLPLPLPALVQVQVQDGVCYEATYEAGGMRKNSLDRFEGRASQ